MSSVTHLLRRRSALVLLPLSCAPFAAAAPAIVDSHARFDRQHNSGPLAAPTVGLSAAEQARFVGFAAPADRVPVLAWQGLGTARDGHTTTRTAFARQLALLHHLGYTAISARAWAAFRAGEGRLPARPILLTFDGGRLDAYRGADRLLARFGMRATMFVATKPIEDGDASVLSWAELHRMVRSGRWDVEPEAHAGASRITTAPDGTQSAYYAARRYTDSEGHETLSEWEARVGEDLFTVRDRFAAQGLQPHVLALPYGDFGQLTANDPQIPGLLSALATRQFGSFFAASDGEAGFSAPGTGSATRFAVRPGTSLEAIYDWLRRHSAAADTPSIPSPR